MNKTIKTHIDQKVGSILLNRPEIHNAFNEVMIQEIMDALESFNRNDNVRVITIAGAGKSFCAGADLDWMRSVSTYTYEQNLAESMRLSECFYALYTSQKPTIAKVHGAAIGGANGLMAACDISIVHNDTIFSLSEVKIGIVPACISPYIIKRVGESKSRELMLTGRRFNGHEAAMNGLANYAVTDVEKQTQEIVDSLLTSGPKAIAQCKELIDQVVNHKTLEEAKKYTAEMIAEIRGSSEGQEGMSAFLEKRKPNWIDKL